MTTDPFDGGRQDPLPPRPAPPRREPPSRQPLAVPLAPTTPRQAPGAAFLPGPRRADDRLVTAVSVVVAAGFLVAAVVAAVASVLGAAVVSPWLPLHLALAGGASTAIAGVMPFFVAALAAGAPAPSRLRKAAVGFVAVGAALVAVRGIAPGPAWAWAPVAGGWLYLTGILWVALAVRASGRKGLMMRRPIVSLGYTLALGNVAVGGILGTLFVAGWAPILERWAQLRTAHAWTNLIGFVSLVIVATLLHLLPTVLGGRIVPRRSAVLAVLGIAMGTPVVVAGLLLGIAPVAGGGATLVVLGSLAMAVEAVSVVRARPLDDRSGLAPVRGRGAAGGRRVVRGRGLDGHDAAPCPRHDGRGLVDAARRCAARRRVDRAGAHGVVDAPAAVDRAGRSGRARATAGGAGPGGHAAARRDQRRDGAARDRLADRDRVGGRRRRCARGGIGRGDRGAHRHGAARGTLSGGSPHGHTTGSPSRAARRIRCAVPSRGSRPAAHPRAGDVRQRTFVRVGGSIDAGGAHPSRWAARVPCQGTSGSTTVTPPHAPQASSVPKPPPTCSLSPACATVMPRSSTRASPRASTRAV